MKPAADDEEITLKWNKVDDRWIAQCIEGDDREWYEVGKVTRTGDAP